GVIQKDKIRKLADDSLDDFARSVSAATIGHDDHEVHVSAIFSKLPQQPLDIGNFIQAGDDDKRLHLVLDHLVTSTRQERQWRAPGPRQFYRSRRQGVPREPGSPRAPPAMWSARLRLWTRRALRNAGDPWRQTG